jgi:hypothetical protein
VGPAQRRLADLLGGLPTKTSIAFWICRDGAGRRWTGGRRDDELYGEYLDAEQARLDALKAARDYSDNGQEAEVWEQSTAARVF